MDYELWLRFARLADPVFIPRDLAAFRWHGASKSSGGYGKAAWEAFAAARSHAKPSERLALAEHFLHVLSLLAGYRILEALLPALPRGDRAATTARRPGAEPRAASPGNEGSS
jgi:hypothetical protein